MRIIPFLIVFLVITSCESAGAADEPITAADESAAVKPAPVPQVNLGEVLVHFDKITDSLALGTVQASLHNASEQSMHLYIEYSFKDSRGNIQRFQTQPQELEAGQRLSKTKIIEVQNPLGWTAEDPKPYQIAVSVFADGMEVNSQEIQSSIVENTDTAFNQHAAHPDRSCMPQRNSVIR